jgi:hypothetical protein
MYFDFLLFTPYKQRCAYLILDYCRYRLFLVSLATELRRGMICHGADIGPRHQFDS